MEEQKPCGFRIEICSRLLVVFFLRYKEEIWILVKVIDKHFNMICSGLKLGRIRDNLAMVLAYRMQNCVGAQQGVKSVLNMALYIRIC